jgi:ketosteroid isomerase-like protein
MATKRSKARTSARRPTGRKARPRARAARPARKSASRPAGQARARAAKPKASGGDTGLAAFARKIVRVTQSPALLDLRELYAEGAVSREATGQVASGLAALEEKLARWESMQEHTEWEPRNVFAQGNTICIEWDATVRMRDGRVVPFSEVAVHEVRDGKIVSERFYYNPLALAPQPK